MEGKEKLAIIREVGIGLRDTGRPILWFSVYSSETCGALQILGWDEAAALICAYDLREIQDLEGQPCWVKMGTDTMRYVRPWKK